jgi:hypothetical protein
MWFWILKWCFFWKMLFGFQRFLLWLCLYIWFVQSLRIAVISAKLWLLSRENENSAGLGLHVFHSNLQLQVFVSI